MSRRNTPPTLDVSWDPNPPKLEVSTGCYSTTLHVNVGGDWQGGFPQTVGLTVCTGGRKVDDLSQPIDIHARHGEFPLTGLQAGKDYSIQVDEGGKRLDCLLSVREPEKESKAEKKLKKLRGEKEVVEAALALNDAQAKTSTETALRANRLVLADRQLRVSIADTEGKVAKARPVKLSVSDTRLGDDRYKLVIAVRDEHGHGVTHCPLIIKDGRVIVTPPRTTNTHGIVEYETDPPFAAKEIRWVEVSAGVGADLNWGAQLRKPSNFTRRP